VFGNYSACAMTVLLCLVITVLVQGLSCCCILQTVNVMDCTATPAHYQQASWHIHIMWQYSLCLWFTAERCQISVHIITLPCLGSEVISACISGTCMKPSLFNQHLYLCATPGEAECTGFLLLPQKEVGHLLRWVQEFQRWCKCHVVQDIWMLSELGKICVLFI